MQTEAAKSILEADKIWHALFYSAVLLGLAYLNGKTFKDLAEIIATSIRRNIMFIIKSFGLLVTVPFGSYLSLVSPGNLFILMLGVSILFLIYVIWDEGMQRLENPSEYM